MHHLRRLLLVVLFPLALTLCVHAQTGAAAISGEVTDPSGAVISRVQISVRNIDTGVTQQTTTNGAGFYSVPGLKPGRYTVTVSRQGFRTVDLTGLTLYVQDQVSRNFKLAVGSTSESITVNGSGININTTDASVSTVIDRQFVENMPLNGRSLQDLLALVPGAAVVGNAANGGQTGPGRAGEITVNGQRTEANSFSVDGVSTNVGTPPGSFGGEQDLAVAPLLSRLSDNAEHCFCRCLAGVSRNNFHLLG